MTNCFDMRCPACGDEDHIDIAATTWIRVCAEGTDADASGDGSHHFTPASPVECAACGYMGYLRDFEPEED